MSTLLLYSNLEKCTENLEERYTKSVKKIMTINTIDNNDIDLEEKRDFHYKEILNNLKEIKERIKDIVFLESSLKTLETERGKVEKRRSIVDKNYIKKQIETFQNLHQNEVIHRRDHKVNRPPETSSVSYLESWEKYLDNKSNVTCDDAGINKRTNSLRKNKKIVSSTLDMFLEKSVYDDGDCLEDVQEVEDTKPRIVDMIEKKVELESDEDTKPKIVGVVLKTNKT